MPSRQIKKSPWLGVYQSKWKGHKIISSFDIKLMYYVIVLQVEPRTPFITHTAPCPGSELYVNGIVRLYSHCRLQSPISTWGPAYQKMCLLKMFHSLMNCPERKLHQDRGHTASWGYSVLSVKGQTRSMVLNKKCIRLTWLTYKSAGADIPFPGQDLGILTLGISLGDAEAHRGWVFLFKLSFQD